jgi:signal transduction histidine kinase
MESASLTLAAAPVAMNAVIRQVIAELQALAGSASVSLADASMPDLPVVMGDPTRLAQVVRNLVHNAIKFTPANGHVSVSGTVSGDALVICVTDDGIGMSKQAMAHLFERFYQADCSNARRFGGTGLGLYICKRIVLAHGGEIWAESELGKGSTFCFALPL